MEVVLFVGLQGAGKTTFYRTRFSATHVLVSKDLFRSARDREHRQRALVRAALAQGASVVVDNTNPTADSRAPLIEIARAHGARIIGYFFEPNVRACLSRNRAREGKERVPDVALFATAKRLEPPRFAEGFDAIYAVRALDEGAFDIAPYVEPPAGSPEPGAPGRT